MEDDLAKLGGKQTLWVMHNPPYGEYLDVTNTGIHAGSRAIRDAIFRQQPTITLHGHIHEAPEVSGCWYDG